MTETLDFMENFPSVADGERAVLVTKRTMKRFVYPPKDVQDSDLNWVLASTDRFMCGIYQLPPGGTFDPPDIHAGDEAYRILQGRLTMLNPETGQVVEVEAGEGLLIPKGSWHKAYNFGQEAARILYTIAPQPWSDEVGLPDAFPGTMRTHKVAEGPSTASPAVNGKLNLGAGLTTIDDVGSFPMDGERARELKCLVRVSRERTLRVIHGQQDPVVYSFFVSNDLCHLGEFAIPAGGGSRATEPDSHAGDCVLYVEQGPVVVFLPETHEALEAESGEAVFLAPHTDYQCVNYTDETVRVIFLVAPEL